MSNEIKRMNYYDGLFLKQEEFQCEQNYHNVMRGLHNRYLHTCGIVYGLDIVLGPGDNQVTISEGIALDRVLVNGEQVSREIILRGNNPGNPLDFSTKTAGAPYWVVISYAEKLVDTDKTKGDKEIHIWPFASIEIRDSAPNDNQFIILAKITPKKNSQNQILIDQSCIDNSIRSYAGAAGKTMETEMLTLGIPGEISNLPSIRGSKISNQNSISITSPLTQFSGKVSVGSDLEITGNCTIKGGKLDILNIQETTIKVDRTEFKVSDPVFTVNKYDRPGQLNYTNGGLEVYRGDATREAQIIWDESVDRWKIGIKDSLSDIPYGTNTLKLIDGSLADEMHKHNRLYPANGGTNAALTIDSSGKIGIGLSTPATHLHIERNSVGNDREFLRIKNTDFSSGNCAYISMSSGSNSSILSLTKAGSEYTAAPGYANFGALECNGSGLILSAYHINGNIKFLTGGNAVENERMRITNDGKVFIGTASPLDNTAFKGLLRLEANNSLESNSTGLTESQPSYGIEFYRKWSNSTENLQAGIYCFGQNSWGAGLAFRVRPGSGNLTTSMVINQNGNIGIGVLAPSQRLEVNGNTSIFGKLTLNLANNQGWNGNLNALSIYSPDNNYYLDLKTTVIAGGNVGYNFNPNGNIGLVISTPGNVGIGAAPSSGYKLEVSGILKSNGAMISGLAIGCKPPSNSGVTVPFDYETISTTHKDYNLRLHSFNEIYFHVANSPNPQCGVNRSGNYFGSTREMKTNFDTFGIAEALDCLNKLSPIKFCYKDDPTKKIHAGFIAEDSPDITTNENKKMISPLDILAILTKVVKEQQNIISKLKKIH